LAIVGLSLKFPEDATDADSFWDMVVNGRNVSTEFPIDRLNIDTFNDPKNDRQGTVSRFKPMHCWIKSNISMIDFDARWSFHPR
jgi:acyl transferase domain-containing protein